MQPTFPVCKQTSTESTYPLFVPNRTCQAVKVSRAKATNQSGSTLSVSVISLHNLKNQKLMMVH